MASFAAHISYSLPGIESGHMRVNITANDAIEAISAAAAWAGRRGAEGVHTINVRQV